MLVYTGTCAVMATKSVTDVSQTGVCLSGTKFWVIDPLIDLILAIPLSWNWFGQNQLVLAKGLPLSE